MKKKMSNKRPPDPPKPERNKPCPCNSGRKYKKCCFLTKQTEQQEKMQRWKDARLKRAEEARKRREAHLDNVSSYAPQPRSLRLFMEAASMGFLSSPRRRP